MNFFIFDVRQIIYEICSVILNNWLYVKRIRLFKVNFFISQFQEFRPYFIRSKMLLEVRIRFFGNEIVLV